VSEKMKLLQAKVATATDVPEKMPMHLCDLIFMDDLLPLLDKKQE
jgi:hypothetical protein